MFHLIYTQRRRILFTGLFWTLSLTVGLFATEFGDAIRGDVPTGLWLAALALTGIVLMAALALLLPVIIQIPVLREHRFVAELLSLMLFCEVAIHAVFDLSALGVLSGWVWLPMFLLIYGLTYGPLLDNLGVSFRTIQTAGFVSALPRDQLWHRLRTGYVAPGEGLEDLVAETIADDEDPATFEVKYRMGHGFFEHQTISYCDEVPGQSFRYHYQSDIRGKRRNTAEGIYSVALKDAGKGRMRVTITNEHIARLPSVALACWFDDETGDRARYFGNCADGRLDWTVTGKHRRRILAYS